MSRAAKQKDLAGAGMPQARKLIIQFTVCLPAFGEELQALLNTVLVSITISSNFSSELMTVKALCFSKYHKISLDNDTEFWRACLLGGQVDSWRKTGKWRRGFAEIVCGKRRG